MFAINKSDNSISEIKKCSFHELVLKNVKTYRNGLQSRLIVLAKICLLYKKNLTVLMIQMNV